MNCSCKDNFKPREVFTEEYGDLINEIEMYKHDLDEGQKILCSSSKCGKGMSYLTEHKSTIRIYQLNF